MVEERVRWFANCSDYSASAALRYPSASFAPDVVPSVALANPGAFHQHVLLLHPGFLLLLRTPADAYDQYSPV
jgi:hypothetical protein